MNLQILNKYFIPTSILDIGVHQAQFYSIAKNFFPNASFFLIEGNTSCEPLIKTLNVPFLIKVLGKENKKGIFYKTKESQASSGESLYREITPHFSDEKLIKEDIDIFTLDSLLSDKTFDLIKIDTQGSELDILAGGMNLAKKSKGIILEVSVKKYNEGAPLYDEVVQFMHDNGFIEKECLDEKNIVTNYNLEIHQKDILFINKNYIKHDA